MRSSIPLKTYCVLSNLKIVYSRMQVIVHLSPYRSTLELEIELHKQTHKDIWTTFGVRLSLSAQSCGSYVILQSNVILMTIWIYVENKET